MLTRRSAHTVRRPQRSRATPLNRCARRGRQASGGQIMMAFAIMFGLFMFGLIAAVIDLATLYGAQSQLAKAAQDGAVAGAANVNVAQFRLTGTVALNSSTGYGPGAPSSAFGAGPCSNAVYKDLIGTPGVSVHCLTGPAYKVTVTVTRTVSLPIRLGLGTVTVQTSYVAIAQCGTTTASAGCD